MRFGQFFGKDKYTTMESERLIRLPMWYGLREREIQTIINAIKDCVNLAGRRCYE